MFTIIENFLDSSQLSNLNDALETAVYVPGSKTAGPKADKNNIQAENAQEAERIIMPILAGHHGLAKQIWWKAFNIPIFAMYTEGMGYGNHIDTPIMKNGPLRIRSDIAMTLFLNNPEEYDGGELCVNSGFPNETRHKLPAGSMIVYPANSLHCVKPITRGVRKVMVTWAQSYFREQDQLHIVSELTKYIDSHPSDRLEELQAKLVRMWIDV